MRQPKRLAHRQAEQTRARAQQHWGRQDVQDDLDEFGPAGDALEQAGRLADPPLDAEQPSRA